MRLKTLTIASVPVVQRKRNTWNWTMSVSFQEIDGFVNRLMDDEGEGYVERLGRKVWHLEHAVAENYGCGSCRPTAIMLARAKHDGVNIQLGKPVHDAENFLRAVAFYNDAAQKIQNNGFSVSLGHHTGHLRGTRISH